MQDFHGESRRPMAAARRKRTFFGVLLLSFAPGFVSGFSLLSGWRHGGSHASAPSLRRPTEIRPVCGAPRHMLAKGDDGFSMADVPLNQIFRKAVVLQRSGDRSGAIREYEHFLKVAKSYEVDPSLYVSHHRKGRGLCIKPGTTLMQNTNPVRASPSQAEVYANLGAIHAMRGKVAAGDDVGREEQAATRTKAKEAFSAAVR